MADRELTSQERPGTLIENIFTSEKARILSSRDYFYWIETSSKENQKLWYSNITRWSVIE